MIISGFLNIVYYAILALTYPLRYLPDYTIPAELSNAVVSAGQFLSTINQVFPVSALLASFGIFIALESAIFVLYLVLFVIKKIPTI